MARVALLSRKMSPQVQSLAQSLKFHHHDVTIMTSQNENIPDNIGFPVLTFFKKWTVLEALQFFPRILGQAPDVWHFVFSDSETEKPSGAHWMLAQLAKALPGRVVAASFYDSLYHLSSRRIAPFIKSCDIVTTASRENLMYLKRKNWLSRYAETEVLPPFMIHGSENLNEEAPDQELEQLIRAASPYIVIPSEKLRNLELPTMMGPVQILVCGSRPLKPSPDHVFYVGRNLSESAMTQVLRGSVGLLTAFDEFSVVELLHFHRLCQLTKTPTLASLRQTEALPGFCIHRRNGFVLDQGTSSLRALFQSFGSQQNRLELSQPLFEQVSSNLADSALNELNRLYSKVKNAKTSGIDFKRSPIS